MLYNGTYGRYTITLPLKLIDFFTLKIGRWLISSFTNFFSALQFTLVVLFRGLRYTSRSPKNNIVHQVTLTQIIFSGIDAFFPTLFLLSLLVGLAITSPLILFLQSFATDQEVITMLTHFIGLQLSSIITSIILIARSGSAIAVDLGNMSIRQEIKGLLLLGIDPYVYFAYPRFIGLAISHIALTVYFAVLSMLFGVFFAALESPTNFKYFSVLLESFDSIELALFILKNACCGIAIAAYACFFGLNVKASVTEVPQATQQAIIKSLMLVFFINALFVLIP